MKPSEFTDILIRMMREEQQCMQSKGADYAGNNDRLNNFKEVGRMTGLSPIQVWAVYFLKHVEAIMTYVKTGSISSEPIESRIMDARNYLALFRGLVEEDRGKPSTYTVGDAVANLAKGCWEDLTHEEEEKLIAEEEERRHEGLEEQAEKGC